MNSNLAQIMQPLIISNCIGICIEARSLIPFAPEPRKLYESVANVLRVLEYAANHALDTDPLGSRGGGYHVSLGPGVARGGAAP